MMKREHTSRPSLKPLLALAVTPILLAPVLVTLDAGKIQAQSATEVPVFKLPSSLPSDTTLKVDGSSSMAVINEALKNRFEAQFPGTTVELAAVGTDEALKALLKGEIDLAAIGRPLTEAEKAQGLTAVPISREKIAVIVSSDNPFQNSITAEQFAKIFRGEITNWSEVGGQAGAIRVVDRPAFSDTRSALGQYPMFQTAPLATGANATQVSQDDTAAVVKELGRDGIGYAIASQVINNPNVRVLALHETLPSDPRYPFSQPRGYAYKGEPNPGIQAFLGFATSKPGQEVIQAAKTAEAEAIASPSVTASPEATVAPSAVPAPEVPAGTNVPAAATGVASGFPWWWLLIPLLGMPALLLWLKGREGAAPLVAAGTGQKSRLILTPRNCRDAYAYWEIADEDKQALRQHGGHNLALRLYDVTDIHDMDRQTPHRMEQFDCHESDCDYHLPITVDNRDYVAELGYVTKHGKWLKLARSPHVRVPACTPTETGSFSPADSKQYAGLGTVANGIETARTQGTGITQSADVALAGSSAVVAGAVASTVFMERKASPTYARATEDDAKIAADCRIVLVPRDATNAYAYWEVSEAYRALLREQGGRRLTLRIHDVTNLDINYTAPHRTQEYACSEIDQDKHVPIPALAASADLPAKRDYIAELGYYTDDHRWLSLARSVHVQIPSES